MPYLIKVATIDIILSLHRRGWSQRRIATELDINRETVARYLKRAQSASKPANAPTGSDTLESASKPANAPTGSDTLETGRNSSDQPRTSATAGADQGDRRKSECEPWREVVQSKCDLGLSAQRIYQDLTTEHEFSGSYYSVRKRPPAPRRSLAGVAGGGRSQSFGRARRRFAAATCLRSALSRRSVTR